MRRNVALVSVSLLILGSISCFGLDDTVVHFNDYIFSVEVAQTRSERARGLMHREQLEPDEGMLFVYEKEGERSFWMKNTLIPLDIIWIDADKEVVFIHERAQPCKVEPCPKISPDVKASYVLELNAGSVEKIGLSVGDKLEFDIEQSQFLTPEGCVF